MSLSKRIAEEMKVAMRAKDKDMLESLRSIKSAIMTEQTKKGSGSEMSEAEELQILKRLQKQRRESMEVYQSQGREDLAEVEQKQLGVIESFLPQQMEESELRSYLEDLIAKLDAQGPKDMGKVMGTANKELSGKADGKRISEIVKELLNK